jgi:hypothetical protein
MSNVIVKGPFFSLEFYGTFALKSWTGAKEGSCHLNNHHTPYSNFFVTVVLLEGVDKLAL